MYSDADLQLSQHVHLDVPPGHTEQMRLDAYITQFVQNATRSKVQEAIKAGQVMVNEAVEKASYRVKGGDRIHITIPKPPPPEAVPEQIPLDIVFEDDYLVIINKPAGMVVHPAFGNWTGTLVNGLLYHLDEPDALEDEGLRPGIVHRLDKDTSGLLVVAKSNHVLAALSALFAQHTIERTYYCVVWGHPPKEGTIEAAIGRSRKDRKVMAVVKPEEGKHAVTHYKVLEYFDHLALCQMQLETGRTHQIRVHLSHLGHPILGDSVYGGDYIRYGTPSGQRKSLFDSLIKSLGRQCLHAKTLGFIHPVTQASVHFDSELPEDFKQVLTTLRTHCQL